MRFKAIAGASILIAVLLFTLFPTVIAADQDVTLTYQGEPGGSCWIEVIVNNHGNATVIVTNVTVVLIFPYDLGSEFLDPNITYNMFSGEQNISPGGSERFTLSGGMPDWIVTDLDVIGHILLRSGEADIVMNVTAPVTIRDPGDGPVGGGSLLWLLVPLSFVFVILGQWLQYQSYRSYWDVWVKERIDDPEANIFMRWAWIEYRLVDEGRGYILYLVWMIIATVFSLFVLFIISKMA